MPAPSGYTTVTVARTGISSYTNIGHVIRVNAAPFAWLHMVSDEKKIVFARQNTSWYREHAAQSISMRKICPCSSRGLLR